MDLVKQCWKHLVIEFQPMSDRLCVGNVEGLCVVSPSFEMLVQFLTCQC